jgi:hypothetical protein
MALLAGLATGCGSHANHGAPPARPPRLFAPSGQSGADFAGHHVVMVEDDGFDTSDPVFAGKVVQSYSLLCNDIGSPADNVDATLPFDQQKAAFLQAYTQVDGSCDILPGIKLALAAEYDDVAPARDGWNAQVEAHHFSTADTGSFQDIIDGDKDNLIYHGTSTAGLVAYANPDVRLVLVQEELAAPDAPEVDNLADCPTQPQIDLFVKLHQDPDVHAAYVQQPMSQIESKLLGLVDQYGVKLINLSLGDDPRPFLEQALVQEGCGKVDYTAYFTTIGGLDLEKDRYRYAHGEYDGKRALTLQAGGNEATQVDDLSTAVQCSAPDVEHLIVGAVDSSGARTDFTNYGKCIDFSTLGLGVVVALPQGFLDEEDGTSFATPLAVRYASLSFPVTDDGPALVKDLQAKVDAQGNLPSDAYPPELAFAGPTPVSSYSLVARHPRPRILRRTLGRAIKAGGGLQVAP